MIPDPYARSVCLPVVLKDGTWLLFNEQPLPAFRDGTLAELVMSPFAFVDKEQRKVWTTEMTAPFLPAGTALWVEVAHEHVPESLRRFVFEKLDEFKIPRYCVQAFLLEDVLLHVRPGKYALLGSCRCDIPALVRLSQSVNETYTRISEAFEPNRRSHTGNVFTKVFHEGATFVQSLGRRRVQVELSAPPGGSSSSSDSSGNRQFLLPGMEQPS